MEQEAKHDKKTICRDIHVRRYEVGEEACLQDIYFRSTRELSSKDYTPEQIERWVAKHSDEIEWAERLRQRNPFVATINQKPAAFAELEPDGHIDFFYCNPDWQGCGAGSCLMNAVLKEARSLGLTELFTEVSVTAEPFFSRKGFKIVEERSPVICGVPAKQYIMRKSLG